MIVASRISLHLTIAVKLRADFITKVVKFGPSLLHALKLYGNSNTIFPAADGEAANHRCMIIVSPMILIT